MNKLIFGRNSIERITSCEIVNSEVHLFRELEDGSLDVVVKPNYSWILAPIQLDSGFSKLDGNLYYSWIKTYPTRLEFIADKKKYYKRDIYSVHDEKEASMLLNGFTYFKNTKVHEVSTLAFDIESTGLQHDDNSKVVLIANTFRKNGVLTRKLFCYDEYETEAKMFDVWCAWVRECNPSIMLGYNIFSYDIPYLAFCAEKAGTTLKLGRDGSEIKFADYESEFRVDGTRSYKYKRCYIFGREIIDGIFIAHKFDIGKKYSSYRLKTVIKEEGLEIQDRQFYDAGEIRNTYKDPEEMKKIKAYAEQDGDDALNLFDLQIPSYFYLCRSIPKPFQQIGYSATGSQINSFLVRAYLQDFHSIPKASEVEKYEGGISNGFPGVYKNAVKWDVKSMYPSIMLQYNVYDRYKDPNGYFIQMVEYFTKQRFENKRLAKETGDRYYMDMDASGKQIINSAYGMMGAMLNFNSPKNAAFVTQKGRELLMTAVKWATGKEYSEWVKEDV